MLRFRRQSSGPGFAALALAALALPLAGPSVALAQTREDTLLVVTEEGPSTLDIDAPTANVETHEVSWNTYDRLITHARKQLPDGSWTYDYTKFEPELATSWELAPDGKSVTFHLRPGREFPRRKPGHRQGREMVVRPGRRGRRLSRRSRWARAR